MELGTAHRRSGYRLIHALESNFVGVLTGGAHNI
jgi:hypothetical protein